MPPKKARAASSKASTSRKTSVVAEDEVVEPTKTPKPRAKGKGKGKAKQQEEQDEDEEGEDQEKEGKESGDDEEDEDDIEEGARTRTTERNKLDTICNQAILAICRLNVLHPPRPLRFGVWNSRPLDEVKTTDLLNAISKSELRPFATGNLLALIIEKEALDPTCMKKDPNAEEAPFLKLTQEAQNSDMELTFAGGRHRMEVTSRLEKKSAAAIARLQEQIEVQTHKKEVAVQKLKPTDTIEERITRLEEELKGEQEVRDTIGIWGVIVYDKVEFTPLWGFLGMSECATAENPQSRVHSTLGGFGHERVCHQVEDTRLRGITSSCHLNRSRPPKSSAFDFGEFCPIIANQN
ncbi:hypothetical protein M378DRAFT_182239 [Amanita muscaria Koide BX008]|uniref:Uncharacterized protein n=1 Tax=Amanita muscaria (strain Koide BX008) TaxID=946122 RepID=A0A0C2WH43_AMAMK|nr:hypothetical protein M378DRAFT_182239 [Amanita muscaria Koide BX008]